MDGNQYGMPRGGRPPGRGAAGTGPGARGPILRAHYGAEGEGPTDYETQELSEDERRLVDGIYQLYGEFDQHTTAERERIRTCRLIHELKDPSADKHEPQLPVLLSTIQSKIADQTDNMPEAILTPESPAMQDYAEDATDLVRWVFERNEIDALYQALCEDFYVAGCAVMQLHWDADMDGGQGNIRILRVPVDDIYWDPTARDLQSCRAIIKTAFHPRGWYVEHYPEAGRYVQPDEYRDRTREEMERDADVMMLEAWWREFDGGRYRVHVCHMAGHVLLYDSRREFKEGVYAHGKYPFAMCTYRECRGTLCGRGCVDDFVELNRYANRNAKYIDFATRMASRPKLILSRSMDLENPDDLTDLDKQVVYVNGMVSSQSMQWMPPPAVPSMAYQMQQWYIDALKQESGQNQFARGEGGMGVTAAIAIQSLQEAGAKASRMESQRLSAMYREAVNQVLWMIAEFFDPPRVVMITGKLDSPFVAQALLIGRGQITDRGDLRPAYRVNLQIRRRNPLRVEAENQLVLQLYQMAAGSQEPIALETVLELLQLDGKDRILPKLREAREQQAQTQQALMLAQQAVEDAQSARQQLSDVRAGMMQNARAALDRSAGADAEPGMPVSGDVYG